MLVIIWNQGPPTWRSERAIVAHFHSSTSRVGMLVLKLVAVVGRATVLENEDELYQMLAAVLLYTTVKFLP